MNPLPPRSTMPSLKIHRTGSLDVPIDLKFPSVHSAPVIEKVSILYEEEMSPLPALIKGMSNAKSESEAGLRRLQTFENIRRLLSEELVGSPTPGSRFSQPKAPFSFSKLQHPTQGPRGSIERDRMLSEFADRTGGRSLVGLRSFQGALHIRGEEFAERLFHALDAEARGSVTDEQLVDTLMGLKHGTLEEKIAFIWSIVARDSDQITRGELQQLLKASCSEGQLSVDDAATEKLASAFFSKAGQQDSNVLSLEDFTLVLKSHSEMCKSFSVGGLGASPEHAHEELSKDVRSLSWAERNFSRVLSKLQVENVQLVVWIILIILSQLAGFIVGFLENADGPLFDVLGWSFPVAKGAARAIQIVLITFPFTVARSLLTLLRTTVLHHVLPLDDHIDFHKQLGYQFFFWSLVHTICHLINDQRFPDKSRHHHQGTSDYIPALSDAKLYSQEVRITGILLMATLFLGYLFAVNWPLKTWLTTKVKSVSWLKNFEAFYYTHILMAVAVLVLLIIHPYPGPAINPQPHRGTTWAYLVGGTFVYILERIARILRQVFWKTSLVGVKLHKGGVTELRLQRPTTRAGGFETFPGKAGQYCFLNIPELAKFEWHPFSLTSGPEDDYISFHIRSAGDWTKDLYNHCAKNLITDSTEPKAAHLDSNGLVTEASPLSVLRHDLHINVDGPFGAPAQDHSKFDCLVLVGAGIGITPFASILRQLLDDYNKSLCSCCKTVNRKLFGPRKVYFIWTTREQSAPQYFKETLEDIVATDTQNFLEISIYLTHVLPQNDLRITVARVAQLIQHEEDRYDALSSTYQPVPCFFGRPSWPSLFDKINQNHAGSKVGVFVCGPPALSSQLKGVCKTYNAKGKKEKQALRESKPCEFVFHKENF